MPVEPQGPEMLLHATRRFEESRCSLTDYDQQVEMGRSAAN